MKKEISCKIIQEELIHRGKRNFSVEYPRPTRTCREKSNLWREINFTGLIRQIYDYPDLDIVKSILFKYTEIDGRDKFILACTLARSKVNESELRVEFGLAGERARTLTHTGIDEVVLLSILGQDRGAVNPILPQERLDNLEGVYFARELLKDAIDNPAKLYDVAINNKSSLFANAADLFKVLIERSNKYKTFSMLTDGELDVLDWKVKIVDEDKTGVGFLFAGTRVRLNGVNYAIKNPPKSGLCIAAPIPYEHDGVKTKRVRLPFDYEYLRSRLLGYVISHGE